ncbi:leucyl aminopeptidase [Clostridium felsineum]|uniref:leucyl aminopeptidase n=1 Tax=Clostridium felsineum TaxID=36839 RepID=UPI00098CD873|nr:leucyl aminopeptidase [Clostridium felsineum]URZ14587.1 Cytosol aminopeptidase [Clostridium felsineum DSM 794]
MKFGINSFEIETADTVIIPVMKNKVFELDGFENTIKYIFHTKKFKGEGGEIFTFTSSDNDKYKNIIFVGIGSAKEISGEKIRNAFARSIKKCREFLSEKVYVSTTNIEGFKYTEEINAIVEGIEFGDYKFDKYKSDKKPQNNIEICIGNVPTDRVKEAERELNESITLVEATLLARNLVNEPANVMTPEALSKAAGDAGKEYGFEVEVFDKDKIKELNMKAFLSVVAGSEKPPKLIVMRYFGDKESSDTLGLVGKGLTYDSGGYSIKTNEGMLTMKSDMGGGAAVIGAISAIAKRKLKVNVVSVIAAGENLISPAAYKPGDIIGSMAGKTIEVINTDAEGRLTLADAVYYAILREKVTKVVDIATLTGAALSALGITTTAVVTNNKEFYKKLEEASYKSGERVWRLPEFDEYKKLIKSDIADLKNVGGKFAGTITAGLFIGEFIEEKPWLHLDIAGTAWRDNEDGYFSKGGTGAGVRILYYLAQNGY